VTTTATASTVAAVAEPVAIVPDVRVVDDAGSIHYESIWTARKILETFEEGILRLAGNIRPDHMPGQQMGTKTRRKIETWASELMRNNAVIGNISIRLDPNESHYTIERDEDDDLQLVLHRGYFDTAIDSESRIKAILMAAKSQAGTFKPDTRFAVRIWIALDDDAKRVAAIYNTRGDKVNDTAAKYAWQQTPGQMLARKLMENSRHLGLDNVEVLSNTVSGSSHKLVAFNTLAQAMETFWTGEPITPKDLEDQSAFLVGFWDALVTARPEYGRLTKSKRQEFRGKSISATAVSIHGLIAAASSMFKHRIESASVMSRLRDTVEVKDPESSETVTVDYFDYRNPIWADNGVLALAPDKSGVIQKQLRMSFQTRRAMAAELCRKLDVPKE